ncbi:hypothetical protein [Klebsiella pneumoniae]|nr:hypothetical protein [Klebsiella pneumoniae]
MKTQNGENIMDQTDSDQNSVVDDDSNALLQLWLKRVTERYKKSYRNMV